jgi:hypothetical protein
MEERATTSSSSSSSLGESTLIFQEKKYCSNVRTPRVKSVRYAYASVAAVYAMHMLTVRSTLAKKYRETNCAAMQMFF